jgi:Glycosyltransferase family 10 (fucosyltransferase) C-term/Fucosyltransferase, N-terminal
MLENVHYFFDPVWLPRPIDRQYPAICDYSKLFEVQCVVFHLPNLPPQTCVEIFNLHQHKPSSQIWVAYSLESEANWTVLGDPEFMSMFDYEVSYRQTADVWEPYFTAEDVSMMRSSVVKPKDKFCAAFISSDWNLSKRKQLLYRLMGYLSIDSYGSFMNNQTLPEDTGTPYSQERAQVKLRTISNYRFTLAFENSISTDYVTEKFFQPLIAGSIPVYWGAPNIEEFSPGENAYINAADFSSIQELAEFLKTVDDAPYHQWRTQPIRSSFLEKLEKRKGDPFDRLWNSIHQEQRFC